MGEIIRKDSFNKKLEASSLIETLVAMVILMLSFGMATVLFVQVTKSNVNLQEVKNQAIITNYISKIKRTEAFFNRTERIGDKTIFQQAIPYKNNSSLLFINVELRDVYDSLLSSHKELIYMERK